MRAPPDDRRVEPVSYAQVGEMKAARDDFERMKIARILLTESMRRLRSGRTLEREHGVIHPELTCIIRDIERLSRVVFPAGLSSASAVVDEPEAPPVELSAGARALSALVARSSAAKVSRVVGLLPKRVCELVAGGRPTDGEMVALERLRILSASWRSS